MCVSHEQIRIYCIYLSLGLLRCFEMHTCICFMYTPPNDYRHCYVITVTCTIGTNWRNISVFPWKNNWIHENRNKKSRTPVRKNTASLGIVVMFAVQNLPFVWHLTLFYFFTILTAWTRSFIYSHHRSAHLSLNRECMLNNQTPTTHINHCQAGVINLPSLSYRVSLGSARVPTWTSSSMVKTRGRRPRSKQRMARRSDTTSTTTERPSLAK